MASANLDLLAKVKDLQAAWKRQKRAFVDPSMMLQDPAAGGAVESGGITPEAMQAAMMGGAGGEMMPPGAGMAPPGGQIDPAILQAALGAMQGGGMAPPGGQIDPAILQAALGAMQGGGMAPGQAMPMPAAGGAPPVASAPDIAELVRQEVQRALSEQQAQQPAPQAAEPASRAPKKKVDIGTELYQIKHLLVQMMNALGLAISPDILIGGAAAQEGEEQGSGAPPAEKAQKSIFGAAGPLQAEGKAASMVQGSAALPLPAKSSDLQKDARALRDFIFRITGGANG